MKLLIASDLHGSAKYAKELEKLMECHQPDLLVFLGDVLYHGPRNPLPEDYNPKEVIEILSRYKDKILAVRGNCDSEVDQMVLPFSVTADYASLWIDGKHFYLTHGHIWGQGNPPPVAFDVLLCGHTHIGAIIAENGYVYANPGSLSLPKDGQHSYMIYENGTFIRKNLQDEEIEARKIF